MPSRVAATTTKVGLLAQTRRFSIAIRVSAATWLALGVVQAALGRPYAVAIHALAFLAHAGALAWGLGRRPDLERLTRATHLCALVSGLGLVGLALLSGQARSPMIWFLALIPMVAGVLIGVRGALAWSVGAGVGVLVVFASPLVVEIHPEFVLGVVERFVGVVTLLAAVLGLSVLASNAARQQLAHVQGRERQIRDQAHDLERARDDALSATRAKSEFLANMSHEIRTPLNGVIGMTALLGRTRLDEAQQHMLRTIERSGRALLGLVDEVLDLARIESGRFQVARAPWAVAPIIDEVVSLVAPGAAERGLTLHVEISKDVPGDLLGDGPRVRQILLNLVGNAIKFTEEGSVTVVVNATDTTLSVDVIDTGVGIPKEQLPLLFQPFTQLTEGMSRRHGGTGLGLAISRRLARMMHGDVIVTSVLGHGSRFRLVLPIERGPRTRPPVEPPAVVDPSLGERFPRRVLVAEDTAVNREVICAMLASFGYAAEVALDGEEALARVSAERFDLVLMDLRMPRLDGLEATRRIRATVPADRQPWIFALTANVLPQHQTDARRAGMDGFIPKPVELGALARALAATGVGAADVDARPGAEEPEESAAPVMPEPLGKLLTLVGGDRRSLDALVAKHLSHADTLLDAMESALTAGDREALSRHAHSLKSSSAMFGADRVRGVAARLEELAQVGELGAAAAVFAELRAAQRRDGPLLRGFRDGGPSAGG